MQRRIQGRGPGGPPHPPLPLRLDQTEARRAEKFFLSPGPSILGDRSPPPPARPPPPYLKVWIRF